MDDRWNDKFDCILANPPFMTPKGGIVPHNKFSIKSSKSEILFVDYIANHLSSQGKAGIIVPDGVVFKGDKAFTSVRKDLVENSLWGVISLPSGIFQPYAGVSTNILLLDKKLAKERDNVLFVDLKNDGFSLTTQRKPIAGNEIPDLLKIILDYKHNNNSNERFILVPKTEIEKNNYDLSFNRYNDITTGVETFENIDVIITRIKEKNNEYNELISNIKEL